MARVTQSLLPKVLGRRLFELNETPSRRLVLAGPVTREAGVFVHIVAIALLVLFLAGVIVGVVAAAIVFSLRRDRRSSPFRVPRKEDD